mmetsp:Transcript_19838/g.35086  ORF Transcript_19838/g.35086 Transcript_19838/m.35086 type:complete len:112 (+) Transcript_19838:402-737(+)
MNSTNLENHAADTLHCHLNQHWKHMPPYTPHHQTHTKCTNSRPPSCLKPPAKALDCNRPRSHAMNAATHEFNADHSICHRAPHTIEHPNAPIPRHHGRSKQLNHTFHHNQP